MSSRKVVQGVLTGFLVFVFIAASIPKISDKLSPNGHLKMVSVKGKGELDRDTRTLLGHNALWKLS